MNVKLLSTLEGRKESGLGTLAFSLTLASAPLGVSLGGITASSLTSRFEHALSERLTTDVDEKVFWMPQNSEPGSLQAVSMRLEWLQEDMTMVY